LKRYILIIFVKLIFYLAIYFAFYAFFEHSVIIAAILIIVTFVFLEKIFHQFLFKNISNIFFPKIAAIEKSLSEFNTKINGIIDYKLLLNECYQLFNKIFSEPQWTLYIWEKSSFLLTRSNQVKTKLPVEINWNYVGEPKLYYDLEAQDNAVSLKKDEHLNIFLNQKLNLLIPITGKNQVIALLFTNIQNKYIFRDPNINELAIRVFQKAGNFLENTALYLDLLHRNLEITKLFEVSEKLLSTLNTTEILDFILESLKEVIPYDAAVIFLLDSKNGKLLQRASIGYGEKTDDLSLKIGQGACGWVAENKQISIIDEVKDAENYYPLREQTHSQVALPLIIHDEILGVICLEKDEIAYFTNNVIEILNIFANQAAIAINNAKQYEISIAKKSLEYELINAGNVQKVLLPKRAPNYKNLDIAFINLPSKIVSGDLYDLIPLDSMHLGVIIGDISGKGAGAAIMMSLLLAGFRAFKKTHFTVCETVARLNNLLEESVSASRYATFFYGIIDLEKEIITYTNAGHNPPLLISKDGNIEKLQTGGIVLGYLANETYSQENITYKEGDLLVLYTDGITEAMNKDMEEFGEKRLLNAIKKYQHCNSYELKNKIMHELKKFTGANEQDDDVTLVIIKRT
jgi:sigma-B regulation protein RsbU (phosphoserine phosphatase)